MTPARLSCAILRGADSYPPLAPADEVEAVTRMAMSEAHRLNRPDLAQEAFDIATSMMPQFGVRVPFSSHLQYPDFVAEIPVCTVVMPSQVCMPPRAPECRCAFIRCGRGHILMPTISSSPH